MVAIDCAELDARLREGDDETLSIVVGWDARAKARLTVEDVELDYGYTILLPDAGADAPLIGAAPSTTFVQYLRRALAYGGFPGWAGEAKRPDEDLAQLTEGLTPI